VRALSATLLYAWRVMINRLPTRDNLVSIGIPIKSNLCVFCNEEEENMSHIMFMCKFSSYVWKRCECVARCGAGTPFFCQQSFWVLGKVGVVKREKKFGVHYRF